MTVDECIDAYKKMMRQIFEKKENRSVFKRLGGVTPQFSSKELENAIKQVLRSRGVNAEEKFETKGGKCKLPALATSAAPTYFSPIAISSSHFIDGALGANNPCLELEEEATDLWCEETGHLQPLVKCFVSIGTGNPGVRSVSDKGWKYFVETLAKEATETEATNQKWLGRWRDAVEKGRAFRFNVDHGLEGVGLAEWKEGDLLESTAATYLGKRGTIGDVRACVENLRAKEYEPTVEFTNFLKQQAKVQDGQRSPAQAKATPTEIAELISLGTSSLRKNPPNLPQAYINLTTALSFLRADPATPPKNVSRLCQKLTQTSLLLSMSARSGTKRKQHADQAREYADKALENAKMADDECMVAQAEFMGACVGVWKVFVNGGSIEKREVVEVLLGQRLDELRAFEGTVGVRAYEEMAGTYLGYLRKM
ncbi:FabD/lysophospholipase-like protein [Periconia macrospinosa]|uniref:FabD/lysophospholipase-like protein n=1 Tax=Periconia macrospinosa TaxID=97972 RepID=A0A2V1D6K8_9PLEO|nr:FabD/lysophospholipase-like protein [Periconia macrospinosa]